MPQDVVVVRGVDATRADVEGVIALDRLCLEARYQVSADADAPLLRVNREGCYLVKEQGTVVASLMVLPVRDEVYALIRTGRFNDVALTPAMIVPLDRPCECRMYFASVVIHPAHRNASLVRLLLDRMFADFVALAERGVWVKSVTADGVTPLGVKMVHLLGLDEVCKTDHGSTVYEVSCLPPAFRPVTPNARLFAEMSRTKAARGTGVAAG